MTPFVGRNGVDPSLHCGEEGGAATEQFAVPPPLAVEQLAGSPRAGPAPVEIESIAADIDRAEADPDSLVAEERFRGVKG
jgi:hypothetical protein